MRSMIAGLILQYGRRAARRIVPDTVDKVEKKVRETLHVPKQETEAEKWTRTCWWVIAMCCAFNVGLWM